MDAVPGILERRTSADIVFETLYHEIVSLDLLPGTKLSEAEIAKRFGISRQPIRDAFARLSNLGLLLIRPQRATTVRRFSLQSIEAARFIRAAVEVEVLRHACASWDADREGALRENVEAQRKAVAADDADAFHRLDYEFHKEMCEASGAGFAFETIAANKAQVDRLCILSLSDRESMAALVEDHERMVGAVRAGDAEAAERIIRAHLRRLDPTIAAIHERHRDYFSD